MSSQPSPMRRISVPDIISLKQQRPIVALTAYTAPIASLLDSHVDILLVGDSLAMVLYGMDSTLPITLDDMIRHGACVVRASQRACIVVDMPFGSYQESPQQAYRHAAQLLKQTGAQAVKMEGGKELEETVHFLTERAIPVMGHIGLKPQHVHVMGGYRYQGRNEEEYRSILDDATCIADAGAFSIVLEGIDASLANDITSSISIPAIGIGAGIACDGQILVTEDMMGLSEKTAKFVKQFANMRDMIEQAAADYAKSVKEATFPDSSHSYGTIPTQQ